MTKVTILCGYLGAGKTTILQNILKNPPKNEKIAVIINEFAAIGIDGKIVSHEGTEIKELNNGCICCTKGTELEKTIQQLAKTHKPTIIIIEASGVASIESFQEITTKANAQIEKIITVIDAKRFEKATEFGPVSKKQIKLATSIIISKTDIASKNATAKAKTAAAQLNNQAKIITAKKGNVTIKDLSTATPAKTTQPDKNKLRKTIKKIFPAAFPDSTSKHIKKSGFTSISYRTHSPINKQKFETFANQIPHYVKRAKGIINFPGEQTQLFNYSSGLITIEPSPQKTKNTDIILIGKIPILKKMSLLRKLTKLKTQKNNRLTETAFNTHNLIKTL